MKKNVKCETLFVAPYLWLEIFERQELKLFPGNSERAVLNKLVEQAHEEIPLIPKIKTIKKCIEYLFDQHVITSAHDIPHLNIILRFNFKKMKALTYSFFPDKRLGESFFDTCFDEVGEKSENKN